MKAEFKPVDDIADARAKKKVRQAFYTPPSLVEVMVSTSRQWDGCKALEPSAGDGRIVHRLLQAGCAVDACETEPAMYAACEGYGARMIGTDFLKVEPNPIYDLIVMNPPFQKGQAQKHIEHAWKFLNPHGQIVSVAPENMAALFWECRLDLPGCNYAVFERLDAEVFKESGASVRTLLCTLERIEDMECCGLSNGRTANAAFTIDSDFEMHNRAKTLSDPTDFKAMASKAICESGGSCYGVNWQEVAEYFWDRLINDEGVPDRIKDPEPEVMPILREGGDCRVQRAKRKELPERRVSRSKVSRCSSDGSGSRRTRARGSTEVEHASDVLTQRDLFTD